MTTKYAVPGELILSKEIAKIIYFVSKAVYVLEKCGDDGALLAVVYKVHEDNIPFSLCLSIYHYYFLTFGTLESAEDQS